MSCSLITLVNDLTYEHELMFSSQSDQAACWCRSDRTTPWYSVRPTNQLSLGKANIEWRDAAFSPVVSANKVHAANSKKLAPVENDSQSRQMFEE